MEDPGWLVPVHTQEVDGDVEPIRANSSLSAYILPKHLWENAACTCDKSHSYCTLIELNILNPYKLNLLQFQGYFLKFGAMCRIGVPSWESKNGDG